MSNEYLYIYKCLSYLTNDWFLHPQYYKLSNGLTGVSQQSYLLGGKKGNIYIKVCPYSLGPFVLPLESIYISRTLKFTRTRLVSVE